MLNGHVTLIVDREFGQNVMAKARLGPVWVINSPANKEGMKALWSDKSLPPDYSTIFVDQDSTPEVTVLEQLDNVDMHHHDWASLEVVGAPPTDDIVASIREYGDGSAQKTETGFIFSRKSLK
jgi:hypothetical protein